MVRIFGPLVGLFFAAALLWSFGVGVVQQIREPFTLHLIIQPVTQGGTEDTGAAAHTGGFSIAEARPPILTIQ